MGANALVRLGVKSTSQPWNSLVWMLLLLALFLQPVKARLLASSMNILTLEMSLQIHSPSQMEWHKISVDDKSIMVGGTQCIQTLDGYALYPGWPCINEVPWCSY